MRFKRQMLRSDRQTEQGQLASYPTENEHMESGPPDSHGAPYPLSEWLPTIRAYMSWIFGVSIVWELACLPLSPVWPTGSGDQIALATIRAINVDLIIALASLFATLVVFGNSRWPEDGYRRICFVTISIAWGFSMLSLWLFGDASKVSTDGAGGLLYENIYADAATHLKWFVLPTLAFWLARRPTDRA